MIDKKRAKVLKRREALRAKVKKDRAAEREAFCKFAKENPTPRLLKERQRRFRTKVQMVEQQESILQQIRNQPPELQSAVKSEIEFYLKDPAVMAAVERRANEQRND